MSAWPLLRHPRTTRPLPGAITLLCDDPTRHDAAMELADWLGLPVATEPSAPGRQTPELVLDANRLALYPADATRGAPLQVDFSSARFRRRLKSATAGRELLARAAGVRGNQRPTIVDATAGLGRDSMILATLGCTVTAVERNPVVAALLADGLQRAQLNPELTGIVERITLEVADARDLLGLVEPDTVLIDPMFPARRKSAAVGREMQIMQAISGTDDDSAELLATALASARRRVVVKRPRHAPVIAGPSPTASLAGSAARFDLYAGDRLG